MYWESYTHSEIKKRVFAALEQNLDYRHNAVLGLPASYLDPEVFYDDAPFLKDAPFLSAMIANPNHIGCHTLTESEEAFQGTHQIERELIQLCAHEIFGGQDESYDGYVASGGTEANIQAIWILKNYFEQAHGAKRGEVALVYSQDAHYSMPKAARLLGLPTVVLAVDDETRAIPKSSMQAIADAQSTGVKHFIMIMNMGTTMFGSVDNIQGIGDWLDAMQVSYKIHVDAAYGGFVYPFATEDPGFTFENPRINSFTLDGHKMLQSPYGTGMFIIRKGFMDYALTEEANYVKGKDYTLVGSRSGANAIAVWMIMRTYGSEGWKEKVRKLLTKTDRLCARLDDLGVKYFRHPKMNIVTLKSEFVDASMAHRFLLVPDSHHSPKWYKIVVMDHVTQGMIDRFLGELEAQLAEAHPK